ncbi:hypothetical protein K8R47_03160 [archaeon]|nr:hypothetical protein [archaeon]
MKILRFLAKLIGGMFLTLGLTLFILSFFINYSLDNVDTLEETVDDLGSEFIIDKISEESNMDKDQLLLFCEQNPEDLACAAINNPVEASGFSGFINKVQEYDNYVTILRFISYFLFLIGFLLIWLGAGSIINALYLASLKSTITSLIAIIYYNLLPKVITNALENMLVQQQGVSFELLEIIREALLIWVKIPVFKTVMTSIIITIIFGALTLLFFLIKRKILNKDKEEGKIWKSQGNQKSQKK